MWNLAMWYIHVHNKEQCTDPFYYLACKSMKQLPLFFFPSKYNYNHNAVNDFIMIDWLIYKKSKKFRVLFTLISQRGKECKMNLLWDEKRSMFQHSEKSLLSQSVT